MTLGTALFASVLLVLLVYHKQFRKVFLWIATISVGIAGLYFLGTRLYERHEEKVRIAERKKLVDACTARFPLAGDANNQSCEDNPSPENDALRVVKSEPLPDKWEQYAEKQPGPVIELHGGETLKVVHPHFDSSSKFDPSTSIPVIYLGHNQRFVFWCGNFGEQGTPIKLASANNGTISCP